MDSFKLGQRRWIAEHFKDCLTNTDVDGEPYFKRLGPTTQSIMREAVLFSCLHKPMKGIPSEEDGVEFITILLKVIQPGTNDKIVLERKFNKSILGTK